jgi:hypothetical protein
MNWRCGSSGRAPVLLVGSMGLFPSAANKEGKNILNVMMNGKFT